MQDENSIIDNILFGDELESGASPLSPMQPKNKRQLSSVLMSKTKKAAANNDHKKVKVLGQLPVTPREDRVRVPLKECQPTAIPKIPSNPQQKGQSSPLPCGNLASAIKSLSASTPKCESCEQLRKSLQNLESSSMKSEEALHLVIKELKNAVTNATENGREYEERYQKIHSEGAELYVAYERKCRNIIALNGTIKSLEEKETKMQCEIEALNASLEEKIIEVSFCKSKLKKQASEFRENFDSFKGMVKENEDLKKELQSAYTTLEQLQELNADLMKANEELESNTFLEQDSLKNTLLEKDEKLLAVTSRLEDVLSELEAKKKEYSVIDKSTKTIGEEHQVLETKLNEKIHEALLFQSQLNAKVEESKFLSENIKMLENAVEELKASKESALSVLESKLSTVETEIERKDNVLSEQKKEIERLLDSSEAVNQMKQQLTAIMEERVDLEVELSKYKEELSEEKRNMLEVVYKQQETMTELDCARRELDFNTEHMTKMKTASEEATFELLRIIKDLKGSEKEFRAEFEENELRLVSEQEKNAQLREELGNLKNKYDIELDTLRSHSKLGNDQEKIRQAIALCETMCKPLVEQMEKKQETFDTHLYNLSERCRDLSQKIEQKHDDFASQSKLSDAITELEVDLSALRQKCDSQSGKIVCLNSTIQELNVSKDNFQSQNDTLREELMKMEVKEVVSDLLDSVCDTFDSESTSTTCNGGDENSGLVKENLELQSTVEKLLSYQFELEQEIGLLKDRRGSFESPEEADHDQQAKIDLLEKTLESVKAQHEEDLHFVEDERLMNSEMLKELEVRIEESHKEKELLSANIEGLKRAHLKELDSERQNVKAQREELIRLEEIVELLKSESQNENTEAMETLKSNLAEKDGIIADLGVKARDLAKELQEANVRIKQLQTDFEARSAKNSQMLKDSQKLYRTLKGHYDTQKKALKDSENSLEHTKKALKRAMDALEALDASN